MGTLLHHLLEESAGRFPDRIAFTEGAEEISYTKLNQEANRLAFRLRNCGVSTGDRVGVLTSRSIAAVTAVYGILKAGAAYVPLDSNAPPGRNALIQADCALKCVVDSNLRIGRALPNPGEIAGTAFADDPGVRMDPEPAAVLTPDALAYILYTSGSTGTPRGVAITHRAALYFVTWAGDTVRLEPEDHIAAGSPFIFDLSVFDLFAGVRAGARATFMSAATVLFAQNAGRFLESHKISVWYTVPSVLIRLAWNGLVERNLNSLRAVLFAGEVFPVKYLRLWMQHLPRATFMNCFGPTETNVCTYYTVPAPPPAETELPIGRPCSGTELFLLDERGRPVPDGATGELWVRGPSVMRGYWNRPEQTAATFREIADGRGAACRTGDLARLAPDGNLIFHGRRDFLIKLRGYRIEPGEVEAALDSHPAVEQSVVFAVRGPNEEGRLVAVVKILDRIDDVELKRHCGERLPPYMIPESFERIDEWPRTATGKIDRAALRISLDQIKVTPSPVAAPSFFI